MAITPYFFNLVNRRSQLPSAQTSHTSLRRNANRAREMLDPVGEKTPSPSMASSIATQPAFFLVTDRCAATVVTAPVVDGF